MDYRLFLVCIVFMFLGIVIMKKNKFYDYPTDDMLFATKLKVFLSGFLLFGIGIYGIISGLL